MNWEKDDHIDVCQNIEFGLKKEYVENQNLTDVKTVFALDNAKIAVKQFFGFAKNERVIIDGDTKGIIDWCVSIGEQRINGDNNLTLKEYLNRIDKVKRSVERHSEYGNRGYYEFIKEFV
jgi:hypothetical protein